MVFDSDIFLKNASSDHFFYYGEGIINERDECVSDLMQLLIQPKRSQYFFRRSGAGVKDFEGHPIGLMLKIGIPFSIADAIAYRNTYVSDGSGGYPDRRIATAQDAISFDVKGNGNIDITVLYVLFMDSGEADSPRGILNFSTAGIS
jgi:hypothetical protein